MRRAREFSWPDVLQGISMKLKTVAVVILVLAGCVYGEDGSPSTDTTAAANEVAAEPGAPGGGETAGGKSGVLRLNADQTLTRIAFGSCARQYQPQPIWEQVVARKPEVFLFIGDNIYGDTQDMEELRKKWGQLGAQPGFMRLRRTCPVLATWDDHDYGANDAGRKYPQREASQQIFLDFFGEPKGTTRRTTPGVYDATVVGPPEQRVQIILLDTRYFRDDLVPGPPVAEPGEGLHGRYQPNSDPEATVLGAAQWAWLREQLKVPAKLRIIASSIQVIADEHGWETWGLFPHERQRLLDAIDGAAGGANVIISGDRHHAEISRLRTKSGRVVYDVTSSSLNAPGSWRNELNSHRLGIIYTGTNFGMIEVDWAAEDPVVRLQVCGQDGKVKLQSRMPLSEFAGSAAATDAP